MLHSVSQKELLLSSKTKAIDATFSIDKTKLLFVAINKVC